MRGVIDTIFAPLLTFLQSIYDNLMKMSVPLSHPFDPSNYLGSFALLGPAWITFITSAFALAFIYVVALVVMLNHGVLLKFKNTVKWW